jgi:hypothetical protein
MSDESAKLALRTAVLEWQRKYHVEDGDPLLASLELLEIYFIQRTPNGEMEKPPNNSELRRTLEETDRLIKQLTKQSLQLTDELRAVPKLRGQLAQGKTTALIISSLAALGAGVLIGRFLL